MEFRNDATSLMFTSASIRALQISLTMPSNACASVSQLSKQRDVVARYLFVEVRRPREIRDGGIDASPKILKNHSCCIYSWDM